MSRMSRLCGRLAIALVCVGLAGAAGAEELAIQSFNGSGRLVFNELNSATDYRLEWASSPAGPWTNFTSAAGAWDFIPATGSGSVTCSVPVFYRVVAAVTNAWLSLDAAGELAFGAIGVGASATRTLTLRNRGGAALTVTGITYPEGFSGDWSGVIPAGYEQDVTVTFSPVSAVAYSGTLTVHSDAAGISGTLTATGSGSVDYLVIDVSAGPAASTYPVSYLAAAPGAGWSDIYKTTKIVFRLLPAGQFTMGSPVGELARVSNETEHLVTLTQGTYLGVFEVSQKQWERVMGEWPSCFTNITYRETRPVEQVNYNDIRGSVVGAGWPAFADVDATSFIGKLRERTGMDFDLPTESQWEYACRAGTVTALNSGKNLTATNSCPNVAEVGRYYFNGGNYSGSRAVDTTLATAKVGMYLPNAWGLYDMHGNVYEWCLDWYGTYPGASMDPKGISAGYARIFRGGSYMNGADRCRSATRVNRSPDYAFSNIGFRIALPAGQP